MNKFCVIGNPIEHSLSPKLFRYLAKDLKLNLDYQKLSCTKKDLGNTLDKLKQLNYGGANITLPFKEEVLPWLDIVDTKAKKLGAVNVVRINKGKLEGFNTDIIGIMHTLKKNNISVKGKSALIFGSGGAARSACFTLAQMGCSSIYLQNRTVSRAKKMIKEFSSLFPKVQFKLRKQEEEFFLLVNATPLGLKSHPYKNLIKKTKANIAFDLLYSTSTTPFLKEAKKKKMKLMNGMDMFVAQALASLGIWTKKMPKEKREQTHLKIVKYLKRTT